jgi:hypothetical protein
MKTRYLGLLAGCFLAGCSGIWNAGDLAEWVRSQAIEAGCAPESIALDDWYTPRDGVNVWLGECVSQETGETIRLEIGVDRIWTPSATAVANDTVATTGGRAASGPAAKPEAVTELEAVYGPPSQAGFGSAVFYAQLEPDADLAAAALDKYRFFVGELWERYGEEAWLGPWRQVYARQPGVNSDIVGELRSITDFDASLSVSMILDNVEDPERAQAALTAVFDEPAIAELQVFNLGDGEAMSGILVAGRAPETGAATFLVFLLD